jgi:hypothetical protein
VKAENEGVWGLILFGRNCFGCGGEGRWEIVMKSNRTEEDREIRGDGDESNRTEEDREIRSIPF